MTDPHPPAAAQHPAAHWRNAERVQSYRDRLDRNPDERADQYDLLAYLIPSEQDRELRVLDLGAGFGVAAAAVLRAFPNATATLVDMSEAMIAMGEEWMHPYAGRFRYVPGDLVDGQLPEGAAGPYDAAISALALQYIPSDSKRRLFAEVFARLAPGGTILLLSLTAPPEAALQDTYTRAAERERQARSEPPWRGEPGGRRWIPQTLDEHLAMLRSAGFVQVDCFWKKLGTAIFGGVKPV